MHAPPSELAEESLSDIAAQPSGTLVGLRQPSAFLKPMPSASMSATPGATAQAPFIQNSCISRMLHQPYDGWHGREGRAGTWSQRSPAELPSIAAAATGRRTGEFSGELSGLVAKKSHGRLAVPAHYERESLISQACHLSSSPLCMPVTPGPCCHKTPLQQVTWLLNKQSAC